MKKRLDQLLVEKGLFPSRTRAQASILAGLVLVNGQRVDKAGSLFSPEAEIKVKGEPHPYVGRGGVKLEHALREFNINVSGKVALDVGASTGGFTDCMLKHGAPEVYAVDVGYGQLDWKLRQDPRVKVIERTNIRHLMPEDFRSRIPHAAFQTPNFATIDVSFISLSKVLPSVYNLLAKKAEVLALIKPQFEARKEEVGKGGIVKDEKVRQEVIERVKKAARKVGFTVQGVARSALSGADGNVEYFVYLKK